MLRENRGPIAFFAAWACIVYVLLGTGIVDSGRRVIGTVDGNRNAAILEIGFEGEPPADVLAVAVGDRDPDGPPTLEFAPSDGDVAVGDTEAAARRGWVGGMDAVGSDHGEVGPVPLAVDGVHGPSAALAYALAAADEACARQLVVAGEVVVATGDVHDGTVYWIGSVESKIAAAAAYGADVILVPAGQEILRDDIDVIGVADVESAVAVLVSRGGNCATPTAS